MLYLCFHKISCAKDRNKDTIYSASLDLPVPPQPGMNLAWPQTILKIESVYVNMSTNELLVELTPNHSDFKNNNFIASCKKMDALAFIKIDEKTLEFYKRGD